MQLTEPYSNSTCPTHGVFLQKYETSDCSTFEEAIKRRFVFGDRFHRVGLVGEKQNLKIFLRTFLEIQHKQHEMSGRGDALEVLYCKPTAVSCSFPL